jgi:hypothetical protein
MKKHHPLCQTGSGKGVFFNSAKEKGMEDVEGMTNYGVAVVCFATPLAIP